MLVEFSIVPVDRGHMGRDLAKAVDVLKTAGLKFQVGPMGTCVEGDWESIFAAIHRCHEVVANEHERVITTIMIDDRKHFHYQLEEMAESLKQWHSVPSSEQKSSESAS